MPWLCVTRYSTCRWLAVGLLLVPFTPSKSCTACPTSHSIKEPSVLIIQSRLLPLPHIFSQSTMLQVDATFSVNVEKIREVYASIPNRPMNSSEESRLQSLECNILSAARELASDIVLSSGFVAPLAFFCLPQPKQKDVHGTDNGPSSITKAAEMLLSEWELGEDPNLRLHHGIPSHIDQAVGLQRNLPASGHTSPVAKESHRYPSESTSEAKSLPQQTFAPPVLSQSQHNLSQSSMYLPSRNL